MRLCRPGSVLGPQQFFLVEMEKKCKFWKKNSNYKKIFESPDVVSQRNLSPEDMFKAKFGDLGQAGRLINAKKGNQSFTPEKKKISKKLKIPRKSSPPKLPSWNLIVYPKKNFGVFPFFDKKKRFN